ncbi:MAG: hypothetical protein V3R89_00080 [Thermoanaerobaculia bacterium]
MALPRGGYPLCGVPDGRTAGDSAEADCLTVIGWYEEALRMCGAKRVTMTEETCRAKGGPYCRYRVSWEI